MRKLFMCDVCLVFAVAMAGPAIAARPAAPLEPVKMELTKMPVTFNHSTHASVDCGICHHPVEGVETYAACGSSGCHDVLDKKDKSWKSYYRLAHDRKVSNSCLGCHVEVVKTDKAKRKELTSCKGSSCHPK